MTTFESEVREYNNFSNGTLKPATTRGLVVSNVDPLFAGRVKVWIPAIHGPAPYGPNDTTEDPESIASEDVIIGISSANNYKAVSTIQTLPWAKVLSHNLGPIQDITTRISKVAGCFTTPSVGTEVIVMFENDDPTLPIVVGSIIHANEFRYSLARPMEYLPGIELSEVKQVDNEDDKATALPLNDNEYADLVSSVYNVRTGSGSTLFISDSPDNKVIVLEGSVGFDEKSTLTSQEVLQLSQIYPAFPTTASAAFAKRQLLSRSTVSPLSAPSEFIGSDSVTSVTTSSNNVEQTNKDLINKNNSENKTSTLYLKRYPVTGSPAFSNGAGKYGVASPLRKGKKHVGVDIGVNKDGTTLLVAPIDCYPLYVTPKGHEKIEGITLLVRGIDGFAHGFLHLRSVNESIYTICSPGKTATLVKAGTVLGVCGVSAVSEHNTGAHLHWEVFSAGSAYTSEDIKTREYEARHASPELSGMINPLDWYKSSATGEQSVINLNEEQVKRYLEYSAVHGPNSGSAYSKPTGLEMSLTPGRETVTLRHPSGSFIGFDPDGNILIYSCGDINFRANRSITYDVLGVILENALAKYTRVKSVLQRWAGDWGSDAKVHKKYDKMPEFYRRVDESRAIDMTNALASNLGNSFIMDDSKQKIDPVDAAKGSSQNATGSLYSTVIHKPVKSFKDTKWDAVLLSNYDKYIRPNNSVNKYFPAESGQFNKFFKAIMLQESNGNEHLVGSSMDLGLFQITPITFKQVLGTNVNIALSKYYIGSACGEANADIAFQYIVQLVNFTRLALKAVNLEPEKVKQLDFMYLVILSYNAGPTLVAKVIKEAKKSLLPDETITYKLVEEVGKIKNMLSDGNLKYVPSVDYISTQIPGN